MDWGGLKNGELLVRAAASFDVFITVDKKLAYQQNLASLPIAVVILDAVSNELSALVPLVSALNQALTALKPRTCVTVSG
jgi:hypothetical protein